MSKLYEISAQYKELSDLSDGADDATVEAIESTLEGIVAEFDDKARAVAHVILNFEADTDAIDAEIARLQTRKKALVNRQEAIKDYLQRNMVLLDMTKISCPLFTITLAKGREVVVIDDESLIPPEFVTTKTVTSPDKRAIIEMLKSGLPVAGAHIARTEPSIRIK